MTQSFDNQGAETHSSLLLSPFELRGLTLPNRVAFSPMGQGAAINGMANDWHLVHLGQFALAGIGLAIIEATTVSENGRISPGCLGLWNDRQVEPMARIISFLKQHSQTRVGIQLSHSGRKGSVRRDGAKRRVWMAPENGGWPLESASGLPYPGRGEVAEMSIDRMRAVANDFASAARRAHAAGIELIELHAAHGYLLHNFLSPLTNTRRDLYGGSPEARMQYPLEVFDAVRAAWPDDKPLGVRVSAVDHVENGQSVADTLVFAEALKARGCDYVCVSSGGTTPEQKIVPAPHYQVPYAQDVRSATGLTTMAVGLISDPIAAERLLADGQADLIAMCRALIADPRWMWRAADDLGAQRYIPTAYS